MAISIQDAVLFEVRSELLDPIVPPAIDGVYWSNEELLEYYNLGITAIISQMQQALTKTIPFNLVPGVEQNLPADAVGFLKATSNLPYPGLKDSSIIETTAELMQDGSNGTWYGKPPTKRVRHVIPYDPKVEPLRFRVDPPNDGTGQIWLTYSYAPPEATAVTDPFGLTEAYRDAMAHYILSKAYGKNSAKGDTAKMAWHKQQFNSAVGIKGQADVAVQTFAGTQRTTA